MKIRKTLPLVLLAIGSVFLLSSCDAMLDAIFANNTINVYVTASIPYYCPYLFPPGAYSLTFNTDAVTVSITGPTNVTGTAVYTGNDSYYMYWSLSVPRLADGPYTVTVDYYHPYGSHAPYTYFSTQVVSLPAGSSHSVNLSFNF